MAGADERREGSDGHALIRFTMPAPFILEYPEEVAHLVRFMPAAPGELTGDAALMAKWKELVDHGRPVDERDPDSDDGG